MNFLKLLVVISLPISFLLENQTPKLSAQKLESETYELQEEWFEIPTPFTTKVKIACNNDVTSIYNTTKSYLSTRNIVVSDNDVVLKTNGTSSLIAYWNTNAPEGGKKVVVEFKNNQAVVYQEQLNRGNNQWKTNKGVSALAIGLSKKLNTQKLFYK